MKYAGNMEAVSALGPDFMGFIFYKGSKRNAGRILKTETVRRLPRSIKRVGVFVNSNEQFIAEKVKAFGFDFVQLHGEESPAFCKEIAKFVAVIKAFAVDSAFDFKSTEGYSGSCRYFLFDTKTKKHGGSGKTFDWNLLKNYKGKTPYLLSGGIGVEEVLSLVSTSQTKGSKEKMFGMAGIDVNSRVEKRPGLKDAGQLKELLYQLRK